MTATVLRDFPSCPVCGSTERLSDIACAELRAAGKIPADAVTQLKLEITPLEQPIMAGVAVQAIVTRYDACGQCGTPRITRAELQYIPVQVQGLPGANTHRGLRGGPI